MDGVKKGGLWVEKRGRVKGGKKGRVIGRKIGGGLSVGK